MKIEADCGAVPKTPDVRRLFLLWEDTALSLGIPIPENGHLVLRRYMDPSVFPVCPERAILYPLDEAKPASPLTWMPCRDLSVYFNLPRGIPPFAGLICREGKALHLAVPLRLNVPFPCMSVFCFGTEGFIGNEHYLIFHCFSEE